eukprot:scaffold5822_cov255-Prasinococcus_capsulatus_cf.AAC.2
MHRILHDASALQRGMGRLACAQRWAARRPNGARLARAGSAGGTPRGTRGRPPPGGCRRYAYLALRAC